MPTIEFGFAIDLEDYKLSELDRHAGPLFHRWLPNGESDALTLDTKTQNANLVVWFVRRGFVDTTGFIEFDNDKREVDPSIMERQAILDAGPLIGRLTLSNVPDEEFNAIRDDKEDDPAYIELGKRVVFLIYSSISRLIETLRVNFGQYWLRGLATWDSRRESLGVYCSTHLELRWRLSPDTAWHKFRPTKQETFLTAPIVSDEFWAQYLRREDYFELARVHASGYSPDLAATILARAHQNRATGAWPYAFIEAATALELAISNRIRIAYSSSKNLMKVLVSYLDLPVRAQLISLASFEGSLSADELELALSGIEIRNKIVHEGFEPLRTQETHKALEALLSVTAHFLPGPKFRFPKSNAGNQLYAKEKE